MSNWKSFTNLFQPRWRSPDPALRRQAAMALSACDPDSTEALQHLIQDNCAEVREVAIKRINDLTLLRAYLRGEADAGVRTAAAVRYRQLLVGDCEQRTVERELHLCADPTLAAYVAQKARRAEARRAAIRIIRDTNVLTEIALHDDDESNRLLAAQLIDDDSALAELARRARSFAPDVTASAEARLAELAGTQSTAEVAVATAEAAAVSDENYVAVTSAGPDFAAFSGRSYANPAAAAPRVAPAEEEAAKLCQIMESLARIGHLPDIQRRRRQLSARWRALATPPAAELGQRFRAANLRALGNREPGSGEPSRARRQLERLLSRESSSQSDLTSQRLEVARRNLNDLHHEHPDSAHARIALQRLYRKLPHYVCDAPPDQPGPHVTQRQRKRERERSPLGVINEYLRAAEEALDGGDPERAQWHIRAALSHSGAARFDESLPDAPSFN